MDSASHGAPVQFQSGRRRITAADLEGPTSDNWILALSRLLIDSDASTTYDRCFSTSSKPGVTYPEKTEEKHSSARTSQSWIASRS
jgi:hypothetical protein